MARARTTCRAPARSIRRHGLQADTWALSETGPSGYSASGWVCVGGTQSGSNITVGIGGEATCTITNDDIAPKLHLRKVVVNDNGGTATVADFTLTANGTWRERPVRAPARSILTALQADTWALSESTSVTGYTASAWTCVGGTQNGSNITVGDRRRGDLHHHQRRHARS